MKRIFLAICAIATMASSCSKKTDVEALTTDFIQVNSKVNELYNVQFNQSPTQLTLGNSINQFDFVGKLHNIGLESFINNYKQINGIETNKHLNFDKLLNSNTMYLGESNSLNEFNSSLNKNKAVYTYLRNIGSSNESYITAFNSIKYKPSDEFKVNYLKMLNAVDEINFSNEMSFKKYLISIKNIENDIINSSIKNNERDILLATVSITRYSAGYWFYKMPIDKWRGNTAARAQLAGPGPGTIIKWDIAGGAAGGTVGAIVGGTVTIPLGGIGTLPAWLAGAITGAVGGSVGEAVFELLDWLF